MKTAQQLWLRSMSVRPMVYVRESLTDTSSFAQWWQADTCTIKDAEGEPEPGRWFSVSSVDNDGRERRFSGQLLERTDGVLVFSWKGAVKRAVKVRIELEQSGDETQIDVKISGVKTRGEVRLLRREWKQILRTLA